MNVVGSIRLNRRGMATERSFLIRHAARSKPSPSSLLLFTIGFFVWVAYCAKK